MWLGESDFWRDLTVQVVGTLSAGLILFLWARALGYFSHIPWSAIGLNAGGAVAVVVTLAFGGAQLIPWLREKLAKRRR